MGFKKSPNVYLVRNQLHGVIIINLDVLWAIAMVASGNLVFGKELDQKIQISYCFFNGR